MMLTKRLSHRISALLAMLAISMASAAQDHAVVDVALLNLKITRTEVVNEVKGYAQAQPFTIRPGKGQKLVVVTLEGPVPPKAESIAFGVDDFSTMYPDGTGGMLPIKATAIKFIVWHVREHGFLASSTKVVDRNKAMFEVAFKLPKDTVSFSVRYSTIASGKATLSN